MSLTGAKLPRYWVLPAAGFALMLAGGIVLYADSDNGPAWGQSDTGQWVRLLRGPNDNGENLHGPDHGGGSTFAVTGRGATVLAPSYGSGNLLYHGGKVMSNAKFYAVFWNSAVANSTATSQGQPNIKSQIAAFATTFLNGGSYSQSSTDDFNIVGQYGDNFGTQTTPNGGYAGSFVDAQGGSPNIKDSQIQSYLASLFKAGKVPVDTSTIYGVYFPSGMRIMMNFGGSSCSSFCGYHSMFSYNGKAIKYAVFPYTDCSGCKIASLAVADMLTIVTSHEIREAVTDPGEGGNAWYDGSGYEADDKCAWHNLYQLQRPAGLQFWVQPEFSNGGTVNGTSYPGSGCVVPF